MSKEKNVTLFIQYLIDSMYPEVGRAISGNIDMGFRLKTKGVHWYFKDSV